MARRGRIYLSLSLTHTRTHTRTLSLFFPPLFSIRFITHELELELVSIEPGTNRTREQRFNYLSIIREESPGTKQLNTKRVYIYMYVYLYIVIIYTL